MSQNHFGKGDNVNGNKIINLVLDNKIIAVLLLVFTVIVSGYIYVNQRKSDVDLVDVKIPIGSNPDRTLTEKDLDNLGGYFTTDANKTGESSIANKTSSEITVDSSDQISSSNTSSSIKRPRKTPNTNTSTLEVSESKSSTFPEYTFVLRNSGNLEGIITAFVVELVDVKIDSTPIIVFERPFSSPSKLIVKNIGWGDATNFQYSFKNAPEFSIQDTSILRTIPNTPLTITNGGRRVIYLADIDEITRGKDGLSDWLFDPIVHDHPIVINYSYHSPYGDIYTDSIKIRQEGPPSGMFPDVSYICKFDISDGKINHTKRYDNISRNIPAYGSDIFSVMVGVIQSCSGRIRFKFKIDDYWVTSEEFKYTIRNPVGSYINNNYKDGSHIINEASK